ncbi:unnamed protein product, partial [Discosporangium mesarthrocarpum]
PEKSPKEVRDAWIRRRRNGQFYFRTEFHGVVFQVMRARGWKEAYRQDQLQDSETLRNSSSPDKCDGTLTDPTAMSSSPEASPHGIGRVKAGSGSGTASGSACGTPSGPLSGYADGTEAKECLDIVETHDSRRQRLGDGVPQWDVHWSYMKWAVETMRFARRLMPWQRVNHFRNSKELCPPKSHAPDPQDLMLKNLKKRRAELLSCAEFVEAQEYNFFPESYDYALFAEAFKRNEGIWIMKPSGSAEGRGIFLLTSLTEVKAWERSFLTQHTHRQAFYRSDPGYPGSFVAQQYISNPYLIGGKKFDLRMFVLVTAFRPLTVYTYRNGFARFSSARFRQGVLQIPHKNDLMHLTNHAVQRRGAAVGRKWAIKKLKMYLVMRHGQRAADRLFWEIQAILVRTLRSVDRLIIHDKQSFEV